MKRKFRLKTPGDTRIWTYDEETAEVTFETCPGAPSQPSSHTIGSLLGNSDFEEICDVYLEVADQMRISADAPIKERRDAGKLALLGVLYGISSA